MARGLPLAHAVTVTVLVVPLVIVTVALIPAFVICPFLGVGRQRLVMRLLAGLRQWTAAITGPGQPHLGAQGPLHALPGPRGQRASTAVFQPCRRSQ